MIPWGKVYRAFVDGYNNGDSVGYIWATWILRGTS